MVPTFITSAAICLFWCQPMRRRWPSNIDHCHTMLDPTIVLITVILIFVTDIMSRDSSLLTPSLPPSLASSLPRFFPLSGPPKTLGKATIQELHYFYYTKRYSTSYPRIQITWIKSPKPSMGLPRSVMYWSYRVLPISLADIDLLSFWHPPSPSTLLCLFLGTYLSTR